MSIKYRTGQGTSASDFTDLVVKVGDTLPIGTEVDYDGQSVPAGWQEVDETNLGDVVVDSIKTRNLLNGDSIDTATISNNGIEYRPNRLTTVQYIKVKPSTTYTLSFTTTNGINNINVCYYTSASQPRESATGWVSDFTFTTTATAKYIMIVFRRSDDGNIVASDISNVQLEEGSVATSYTEYQNLNPESIDGEWIPITFDNNNYFSARSGYVPKYKKVGKVVYLNGQFSIKASLNALQNYAISNTNLPQPKYQYSFITGAYSKTPAVGWIYGNSITFRPYETAVADAIGFAIDGCYLID